MSDLLRLEHKIDLIIAALQHKGIMLPTRDLPQMTEMGTPGDNCPACGAQVRLTLDFTKEGIIRTCACVPPIRVVAGISSLLNPPAIRSDNALSSKSEADNAVSPDAPPQGGGLGGRTSPAGSGSR
jgi:hypothetical protein